MFYVLPKSKELCSNLCYRWTSTIFSSRLQLYIRPTPVTLNIKNLTNFGI